ncbi:MAG: response regulator [Pseudobdellovibrionaceae bacterium]
MFAKEAKILVVDDMGGIRLWFKKTLKSLGYNDILEAKNGAEAMEMLGKHKFDLMFLDIIMPDTDTMQLAKTIRGNPDFASMKIIIASAESDKEIVNQMVKIGVNAFIVKPATKDSLEVKMSEAYNNE